MPQVTYVGNDGSARAVALDAGETVMEGALANMVEGIVAECGGGLACATCHCYVDDAWIERVGPPSATESDMLDAVASERLPGSRLSCQIVVDQALDGLVVRVPPTQY